MKTCQTIAVLSAVLANIVVAQAQVRFLAHGHTDLSINYDSTADAWDFHVGSDTLGVEFAPDEVVLKVKPAAQTTVPAGAKFAFLGVAGSPIWILPQEQREELLYLGYGGDGIPDGVFINNQVKVTLKSVTGPGNFFSYRVDGFGNPVKLFDSADGISTNDVATVTGGADAHLAWAFSKPGEYKVTLEVSGTLVAGGSASSGPVTFTFSVGTPPKVLTIGHTDLAINYSADANAWDVHVASDTLEQSWDADDLVLQVKGEAKITIPSNPKFSFLGDAGGPIWILPSAQDENLLYLGYGGDGIPDGVFAGNQVKVTLQDVSGPGNFFSYRVDGFGNPQVLFNSADGITSADVATVQAGGDAHLNWAFTKAGDYSVTLEVSGTLAGTNTVVSSGPVTYSFVVEGVLTDQHTDLHVLYDPSGTNILNIVARDVTDGNVDYQTNKVLLIVSEASKLTLPAGTPFGNEGDPLWALTQSQTPDILYLGLSAEGIPTGVFANGTLNFHLKAVDGPGQFLLWQAGQFGDFDVQMNSGDGITDADVHQQLIGSHEHFNWGFTATGVYYVTFQVSGQRIGESTNISSPESTFRFDVLPLPAPVTPIELQQTSLTSGNLAFNIVGLNSGTVDIEATGDFITWTTVSTVTITSSPQAVTIPLDSTKPTRFFRVHQK
ncbi:MAG: LPXTG-motif cell wall anchor domain protein [Verrucomicrobiales bacterium]|nr:LPXTG-motif cell wall anchor domain protein [Verrucomicrobiales bacterium]